MKPCGESFFRRGLHGYFSVDKLTRYELTRSKLVESGGLRVESELEMSFDFCEQLEEYLLRSLRSSDRHPALDAGT